MDSTTFYNFPQLPTELRLEIWELAANVPRTLELLITEYRRQPGGTRSLDCSSRTVVPSVLYTNSESREVGLKFYSREIDSRDHDAGSRQTVPWINWSQDRIFLRISNPRILEHPRLERFAEMCQTNGLRRLVLDTTDQNARINVLHWENICFYAKWWFLDELGFLGEEPTGCQYWCRGFDLAPIPEGAKSFVRSYGRPLSSAWFAKGMYGAWDKARRDDPSIEWRIPLVQLMTVARKYSLYCTDKDHIEKAEGERLTESGWTSNPSSVS